MTCSITTQKFSAKKRISVLPAARQAAYEMMRLSDPSQTGRAKDKETRTIINNNPTTDLECKNHITMLCGYAVLIFRNDQLMHGIIACCNNLNLFRRTHGLTSIHITPRRPQRQKSQPSKKKTSTKIASKTKNDTRACSNFECSL